MKKHNQKGFTIVELVIVIAVIAILAAVLIPTFSNLVKKANLSNDQQNVRNMNTALAVEVIPDSKFATAGDAINGLYREGWNAGKLETYSKGFHYAYSLENNRMYLLDETGTVVYPEEEINKSTLWGFYSDNQKDMIAGIKKYVALKNITAKEHFAAAFAESGYTLDLNGGFIMVDENSNVTANNGVIISGPTAGEGIETGYEVAAQTDCNNQPYADKVMTIEGKLISSAINLMHFANNKNSEYTVKFKNCIFTDAGHICGDKDVRCKLVVEDCKFINLDGAGWGIIAFADLEVSNCEFVNLMGYRGAIQIQSYANSNVSIKNCTFNTIVQNENGYGFIRFVVQSGIEVSANISNNNFASLGQGDCLFAFSNTNLHNETAVGKVTFSNNTVNSSIKSEDYVYNDMTGDVYYNKFAASVK